LRQVEEKRIWFSLLTSAISQPAYREISEQLEIDVLPDAQ
jgi:hypothetical protein